MNYIPKLDKRAKSKYAIFGIDSKGNIYGYTEHSFSMNWSKYRVAVVPLIKESKLKIDEYYPVGDINPPKEIITDEKETVILVKTFSVRISRKKCTIQVNWDERNAMMKRKLKYDKFIWRNLPFTINKE